MDFSALFDTLHQVVEGMTAGPDSSAVDGAKPTRNTEDRGTLGKGSGALNEGAKPRVHSTHDDFSSALPASREEVRATVVSNIRERNAAPQSGLTRAELWSGRTAAPAAFDKSAQAGSAKAGGRQVQRPTAEVSQLDIPKASDIQLPASPQAPSRHRSIVVAVNALPVGMPEARSMTATAITSALRRQGFTPAVYSDNAVPRPALNPKLAAQMFRAVEFQGAAKLVERAEFETPEDALHRLVATLPYAVGAAVVSEPSRAFESLKRVLGDHVPMVAELSGLQQELMDRYADTSGYGHHRAIDAGRLVLYNGALADRMVAGKVTAPLAEVIGIRLGQPGYLRALANANGKPNLFVAQGGDRIAEVTNNSMPERKEDAYDKAVLESFGAEALSREERLELAHDSVARGIKDLERLANGEPLSVSEGIEYLQALVDGAGTPGLGIGQSVGQSAPAGPSL